MESLIVETFELIKLCLVMSAELESRWFVTSIIAGLVLAGLSWWLCSLFARLWNTKYTLTGWHHFLCALCALLVFTAVVVGSSLRFTQQVAEALVEGWSADLQTDGAWSEETFVRAYDDVKAQGKENFAGFPDPRDGGNTIPMTLGPTRELVATVYAKEATGHFNANHPLLSLFLVTDADIPQEVIAQDVKTYFSAGNQVYQLEQAVKLAANHVRLSLQQQAPKVVFYSQLALGGIFLLLFLATLTAIALGAYQDIKVHYANA
jgi:hypothetical protein